jgi:DNA-binding transcriptional LysR family regulator
VLNLSQLEAFVSVAELGGFREAAERLGLSQPTISQQLKKLEDDLKVTLIARDRVRCVPTASGERLLPFARNILAAASRAADVAAGRRLVVGASSNIGIYLLQPYVARYARQHGAATAIDVRIGTNPEIANRLSNGEVDVAVMEWWDRRPGFDARIWRQEQIVVIVPPDHRFARHKSVKPEWLFEEPLIGGEPGTGTGTLLQKVFGKNASRLKVTMALGSTEAVKSAVKEGLGISLVFASAVAAEARAGTLRSLPVAGSKIEKDLYVVLPQEAPSASPPKAFAAMLTAR